MLTKTAQLISTLLLIPKYGELRTKTLQVDKYALREVKGARDQTDTTDVDIVSSLKTYRRKKNYIGFLSY